MARRIREHDWAATPLGPAQDWPQSLKTVVDLMLGSQVVMAAPWGPEGILLYNDAYGRLIGPRGPTALGRPVFEALPELRPVLEPQFAEVMIGRAVKASDQPYPFVRTAAPDAVPEDAWFDVSHNPVRGEDGEVAGILTVLTETTERVEAERRREAAEVAMRESEERQAFLLGLSDALRPLAGPAAVAEIACRMLAGHLDASRAQFTEVEGGPDAEIGAVRGEHIRSGRPMARRFPLGAFGEPLVAVLRAGGSLVLTDTGRDPRLTDAQRAAFSAVQSPSAVAVPLVKGGRLVATFAVHDGAPRDWSAGEVALVEEVADRAWAAFERARAEAALRESEERLQLALDAARMGTFVWYPQEVGRGEPDARMLELFGLGAGDPLDLDADLGKTLHPDDRGPYASAIAGAIDPGGDGRLRKEVRVVHPDGSPRWVALTARTVFERKGPPRAARVYGTAIDITARKEAEATLRESEERQVFLLKLSDGFRADPDERSVGLTCVEALAAHMGADRCYITEMSEEAGSGLVGPEHRGPGLAPISGVYSYSDFPDAMGRLRQGGPFVVSDVANDPALSDLDKASIGGELDLGAVISAPLYRGEGNSIWALSVGMAAPHDWTREELRLVQVVAERTWAAIERARTEEALRESEEKYRTLFDSIDDGFCIIELLRDGDRGEAYDYRFLEVNRAFERQTGLADPVGGLGSVVAPGTEARWYEVYDRVARTGRPQRFEEYNRSTGRWYEVYASRVGGAGSPLVCTVFNDVTARKLAEEERVRRREREVAAAVEAAERERISRELHDRVAHHMGVAHQSLELFAALRGPTPERAEEKLGLARETTRAALDQTRAISAELKRLQEEELEDGLGAALRALAEAMSDGCEIEVSVSGEEGAIPGPVALQAYLAMREAIRNAVRHSGCTRVAVELEVTDGEVAGRVEDDGRGFDPGAVGRATPSWGVGLVSMRERVEMLGGTFRLGSEPGAGTRVELRVPFTGASNGRKP